MAANCGRLLCRSWRHGACRFHRRIPVGQPFAATVVLRRADAVQASLPLSRLSSTKVVDPTLTETTPPPSTTNGRGIFSRFFRWLDDDSEEEVMGNKEKQEREALLQRVQEMYFAKPPQMPGLSFYKEAFSTLVKYNDRVGVDTLWRFMREEMNIQPDEELLKLVEPFMEKAKRNRWFD